MFRRVAGAIAMQQAPDSDCQIIFWHLRFSVSGYTVGGLTAQGEMTCSIYRYSTSTTSQWKLAEALRVLEWKTQGLYLRLPFTHHCDIFRGALWEEVAARGGNSAEIPVARHSTLYYANCYYRFRRSRYKLGRFCCIQVSITFNLGNPACLATVGLYKEHYKAWEDVLHRLLRFTLEFLLVTWCEEVGRPYSFPHCIIFLILQ